METSLIIYLTSCFFGLVATLFLVQREYLKKFFSTILIISLIAGVSAFLYKANENSKIEKINVDNCKEK